MKTSLKFLPLVFAAGAAGAAGFALANSQFSAALNGDAMLGIVAALAIAGLAISDYSRRPQRLSLPTPALRPRLPVKISRRSSAQFIRHRAGRLVA